uniref:Uncharacterized protein n=1 Tax=Oryza glumipatula TaxID=40148 RepID=A0A0E0ATS6_9ORYZ
MRSQVRFPRFSNGGFGRGPLRQYNAALHSLPPVLYAAHLLSVPDPAQGLLDLVRGGHVPTGFKEDGESKSSSLGTKAMTAARHGLWQSMATTAERHRLWQVFSRVYMWSSDCSSHYYSSMIHAGVQTGNEQRCQQEIEHTKHGLESGSITYDPAKLKFSDDIKDSRLGQYFPD